MGKYNFQSSGAAAGNALIDTLYQQRQEARQRMLDEITAKNAESTRAMTAENIADSKYGRLGKQVDATTANFEPNQDMTGVAPEVLDELKRRGAVSPDGPAPPQVSTSIGEARDPSFQGPTQESDPTYTPPVPESTPAPRPVGNFFKGSKGDRDKDKSARQTREALDAIKAHPEMSEMEKIMLLHQAQEDALKPLPGQAYSAMQPRIPFFAFDDANGKATPITGPDNKPILTNPGDSPLIHRPRAPRPERPYASTPFQDESGGIYWANPNTNQVTPAVNPSGVNLFRVGTPPNPNTGKGAAADVPANILNTFTNVQKPGQGGRPPSPQAIQQAQEAVIFSLPTAKYSAEVKDALRSALNEEDPATTYQQIIEGNRDSFANPKDFEAFKNALALVRGSQ